MLKYTSVVFFCSSLRKLQSWEHCKEFCDEYRARNKSQFPPTEYPESNFHECPDVVFHEIGSLRKPWQQRQQEHH